MFVLTTRLRKKRAILVGVLAILLIAGGLLWRGLSREAEAPEETVLRDNEDRIAYLKELGWEVDEEPVESMELELPEELTGSYAAYNELQKSEGLDLSRYKGKRMMRYTYSVTNYDGYTDPVYANILVYKNRVVGGDVCSADPSGFAHGLTKG